MLLALKLPETVSEPHGTPHCPYCGSLNTRFYESMLKKVKHPHLASVPVTRRKCTRCSRTFRHYATGVSRSTQTVTVKTLCVLLYSIGLSYDRIAGLLRDLGIGVAKSTVWRNVRPVRENADYLHNLSLSGRVRVMEIPANLLGNGNREALPSLVAGLLEGRALEIEFPNPEGGRTLDATSVDVAKKKVACTPQADGHNWRIAQALGQVGALTSVSRRFAFDSVCGTGDVLKS